MEVFNNFLDFEIFHIKDNQITVLTLISLLTITLVTKLGLWLIEKALTRKNKFNKLDRGSVFALYQLIKYFVWIIALALMLETVGIKITILLAGSAALLVGIGLGLQQTFLRLQKRLFH